jgi:glutaredoxin
MLPRISLCLLFMLLVNPEAVSAGVPVQEIDVYVRTGCPHCETAKVFLNKLRAERPSVNIRIYDIAEDPAALQRLKSVAAERGVTQLGVPAFVIDGELIVGFRSNDTTGSEIRERLDRQDADGGRSSVTQERFQAPWFGEVRVSDMGLPLFTVILGLLDGFNPCAMWVLLFLLSLLVNLHDRRKMALLAGVFVMVSGLVYFAFMAAWLSVFLVVGISRTLQVSLGAVAMLVGVVNLKDFFALHQGVSFSIPEFAKPVFYARVRRILQAEDIVGALAGIVILAVLVNLIELLCTAGFPALYTQILSLRHMPPWEYYGYLALYNLAYIFDDSLMVAIAVMTLSHTKLQNRAGRWLKLVSGVVMAALGAVLLIHPNWLI